MTDVAVTTEVAKGVQAHLVSLRDDVPALFQASIERSYADWEHKLEEAEIECNRVLVDVIAKTVEQKLVLATRADARYTVPVRIALRQRFGPDRQGDKGRIRIEYLDQMAWLTQTVFECFSTQRLPEELASVWRETKIPVSPITEHLRQMRQWTSVVEVQFEVDKPIWTPSG
jgi:hypothetical protein